MRCIDCNNAEECGMVSIWAIESKTMFVKRMKEDVFCPDYSERIELETRKLTIKKSKTKTKETRK